MKRDIKQKERQSAGSGVAVSFFPISRAWLILR